MKTLARYLAEYIETEMDSQEDMSIYDVHDLQVWIVQGIDAYESTESRCDNCTKGNTCSRSHNQGNCAVYIPKARDLLDAARELLSDFDSYGEVLQTGFDGGYGKDTAIGRLNIAVKKIDNE